MKFEDLKDSSEFAEALGLLASLIAAIMALRNAEKETDDDGNAPADGEQPAAAVQVDVSVMEHGDAGSKFAVFLKKHLITFLGVIVVLQFVFILFIAYRLM